MFCYCDASIYGAEPNTHVCPVCLGLPGALPVPNADAVKYTQQLGIAFNCTLNTESKFDRKHYFYPDLPKGYQISQYKQPLCENGIVELTSGVKIDIERIHLEEDTAKSFHEGGKTLIDFNKSGMPLVEIVTRPNIGSIEDAVEFGKTVQDVVRTLDIGDGDMEKGQLRLEANISLRTEKEEKEGKLPPYKVEVKNINSFRFMEKAVRAEIERQTSLLEKGEKVIQENRGFDEKTGKTVPQRSKEEAHDYRYFPEPDIPPMAFDDQYLKNLKENQPVLLFEKRKTLLNMGINHNDAILLSSYDKRLLFELFNKLVQLDHDPKKTANVLINTKNAEQVPVSELSKLIKPKTDKMAEDQLSSVIDRIIKDNPGAVADFKKGKTNAVEFILGQVMRETKGRADVIIARELIIKSFQA